MDDIDRMAGPFSLFMLNRECIGTAIGRFQKGTVLGDKMRAQVLAMGRTEKEASRAVIRINYLTEGDMDTLLDNEDRLKNWCALWVQHHCPAAQ